MTILVTRLLTGEEILGDTSTIRDNDLGVDNVQIENPTIISAMRNPQTGNVDVLMAPFNPLSSDKTVVLGRHHVLCQYSPVTEVVNKYNSMFGSGIILPNSGGIQTL
jgi:hypothetical protein